MAMTPLPPAPSRGDPVNFAIKGDALMAALPGFVTEANALQVDVTTKQETASAAATTAATKADEASDSANAASGSAGTATQAAGDAGAAAAAALGYKNAAGASASSASDSEIAAAASAASVNPQSLATDYAGDTEPPIKWPYMRWADTGNMRRQKRNAANTNWVDLGPLLSRFAAGEVIQQQIYTDPLSGTNSSTFVPIQTALMTFTPRSSNSKILIDAKFRAQITGTDITNPTCYLRIYETTGAPVQIGLGDTVLSVAVAGATPPVSAIHAVAMCAQVTNLALTLRSFQLYGRVFSSTIFSPEGLVVSITEIQA